MHTLIRGLVGLLLLAAGCATRGASADPVDAYLQAVREKNHIPGVAVAIVRDGKVEKASAQGLADLESEAKAATDTAFQLASVTKVFTGTLVMLLVQEGKLELDAPVSKYLTDAPEAWKAITVRHLAAHASGLANSPDDETSAGATVAERYAAALQQPLAYPPGERSEYGLTDFVVLTHVLEKATGQDFEALLRGRIFEPLGFTCTRYDHAVWQGQDLIADVVPRRATIYGFAKGVYRKAWFPYPAHTYAAGGVFSCVDDLVRWAVALDAGTLLSAESQRAAATAFKLTGGREGGYGVAFVPGRLRGLSTFGHAGGGSLADVLRVPDQKLTVIVLSNAQGLLPVLAPNIASLYLPPLPGVDAPGLEDSEPALTTRLRGVVEGLMNGSLDAEAFAPLAQQQLLPILRSLGTPGSALFPPLRRMTLVEDGMDGETRKRGYRVVYGQDTAVKWTFRLDAEGRVLDVQYDWE
jgi:CubicO group peptidase (beta-lactamase class C family)